jgi:hypothetical protein
MTPTAVAPALDVHEAPPAVEPKAPEIPPESGAGLAECLAVLLGLAAFYAAALVLASIAVNDDEGVVLADPLFLFHRHFWADELHTFAIVADPDLPHAMRALANCVDGSPPTLHLLLRAFTTLTGGASEGTIRAFALLSVVVALLGLYVLLRQSFRPLVALATVLAVACHPLVCAHAFDGRYYGPWLACTVWFAYLLNRAISARGRLPSVLLAASAALLCTIHYFGVFTLGLITAVTLLFHRPPGRARWRPLLAVSCGPAALLASLPFYLGQRAGLTEATWIEPADLAGTVNFVLELLSPRYLWVVVLAPWLSQLWGKARAGAEAAPGLTPLAGLTGLLLLPLVLIAFSLLLQPTLVPRYGLPAIVGLAPALALVLARAGRVVLVSLLLVFLLAGAYNLREDRLKFQEEDEKTNDLIAAIREHSGESVVAFESNHELFVVCRYAPDLSERCRFLDFEREQVPDVEKRRVVVRDLARRFAESYGKPGLIALDDWKKLPKRYLVLDHETAKRRLEEPGKAYLGFGLREVENGLYELEVAPAREE